MRRTLASPSRRSSAFSLLELALVMSLALLVGYLALGGISKFIAANAISTSAQMIANCLAEGRQDAVAQNIPIEVRLYANSTAGYNALQLHLNEVNGVASPAAPPVILPGGVLIDATMAHSTLVTTNTLRPAADATDGRLNAFTRCFHFLSNGSTDLAPGIAWTLTVRVAVQSNPAQFPSNWACVMLDPFTGRAEVDRP